MSQLEDDLAFNTYLWNDLIKRTQSGRSEEPQTKAPPAPPPTCPRCESLNLYEYNMFDCGHYTDLTIAICAECAFAWNPDYKEPNHESTL